MGKASRIKQQSAREKIAAQREAARKAERRNRMLITGGSTLVVLVIVLAFVVIKLTQGSPSPAQATPRSTGSLLPASVASQVTGVPATTLDKVGKGAVPSFTQGQPPFTAGLGRGADQRRQAADALHRRRVLPVLRGHALVDGDRAEPVRHADPAARHPLLVHGHRPEHGDADVLQDRLHQQLPELHAGGEPDRQPRRCCRTRPRRRTRSGPSTSPTRAPAATRSSTSATSSS